ncbi:MAG: hypothetical protein FJ102_21645 [Deltaproteobacteria bacterium]|nr:hypothetical protein [Deltaproteobacteria bacterium]
MLLFPLALAADPLWWTEDGIATKSELFGKAQSRDADAFQKAQGELERAKKLVDDLELGIAIAGSDAARLAYLDGVDRELSGQFLRLQKHTDLLGEDYSRNFGAALERAMPAVAREQTVTQCQQSSPALAALGRPARCPGRDISADLAAAMDKDIELQGAIASILSVDWPHVQLQGSAQAATPWTGTERSVDAASLARALAADAIKAAAYDRELLNEEVEDDVASPDTATREAALARALAARETYMAAVQKAASSGLKKARAAVEKAAKKGGPVAVGLCFNPQGLGGCGLPDATSEVLAVIGK